MDIILNIIVFYIRLLMHLTPYLASGIAVYLYYQYKEVKVYNDALDSFAKVIGGTREDARKAIYIDPFA